MHLQAVKDIVRHLVRVDASIVPRLNDAGDGVLLVGAVLKRLFRDWTTTHHNDLAQMPGGFVEDQVLRAGQNRVMAYGLHSTYEVILTQERVRRIGLDIISRRKYAVLPDLLHQVDRTPKHA